MDYDFAHDRHENEPQEHYRNVVTHITGTCIDLKMGTRPAA